MSLFSNIRFYILVATFIGSVIVSGITPDIGEKTTHFAILAIGALYTALIIGPLLRVIPKLPYRNHIMKARRAVGVSAFYLASLHVFFAVNLLGGLSSIFQLDGQTLLPILFGATSLFILMLMAATSFDYVIQKMTFSRWKLLHRFVYLVEAIIFFHVLLLGSDFADRYGYKFYLLLGGWILLIVLQIWAFIITRRKYAQNQT